MSQVTFEEYIKESDEKLKKLRQKYKILINKSKNPALINIYKSLNYRFQAIFYHIHWHFGFLNEANKTNDNHGLNKKFEYSLYHKIESNALYIFDDIIFNLVSLIDYFSSLLSQFIFHKSLKWNSFEQKVSQDKSLTTKFKNLVKDYHKCWCNPLQDYRADIIHKKKDSTEVKRRYQITKDLQKVDLIIPTPDSCKKMIRNVLSKKSIIGIKLDPNDEPIDDLQMTSTIYLLIDITIMMFNSLIDEYIK